MKQFLTLFFSLFIALLPASVKAAVGTTFSYGSAQYEILSETELTVACLGSTYNQRFNFTPTVTYNGKTYSVTELKKEFSPTRYFQMDFTSFPPSQYKIKVIGDGVFQGTTLDPNTIPPSVEVIGGNNFYGRTDITSVTLPSGVKELGNSCFNRCTNLKTVTFNYNLEKIGYNCFNWCTSLTEINFSYGLKEIGNDAFLECQSLTTIDIKSVEKLGYGCFQACQKLQTVTLPSNLKEIGGSAFLWCKSIKTLIIPANVTSIGDRAFEHVDGIDALIFTPFNEPAYVDWKGEAVDFSVCVDDYAASKMWVPTRKTYEHGQEMITFEEKELIYTGVSPEFEWVNNTPWPVSINTANLPYAAGGHTASLTANFSGVLEAKFEIPLSYTIAKAPLVLKINDFSREYGTFNNNYSCSYEGFVNGETASSLRLSPSYQCDVVYDSNVGTYPINATLSAANYIVEVIPGVCTITKAPLTVKAANRWRAYGETNPEFYCTYQGLKSWDTVVEFTKPIEFECEATEYSAVGDYLITPKGGETTNYEFTNYSTGWLTINKAEVTVFPNNVERYYGDSDPLFTVHYEGLKLGETDIDLLEPFKFSTTAFANSSPGTYSISVTGGSATNYIFSYKTGTLMIHRAEISIKVNDATRQYGDLDPIWTFTYEGLKNDETEPEIDYESPRVSSNAQSNSNIGEYELTVSGGSFKNYTVTEYLPGKLTITKAPVIMKVKDATRLYGERNPNFAIDYIGLKSCDMTVSGPLVDFISPYSISCDANSKSSCGEYSIVVTGGEAVNYEITDRISGKLVITQQTLEVWPVDAERVYGIENPDFQLRFEGFINGDTPESITELPSVVTDANIYSLPGKYELTLTGGQSHNYAFKFWKGELIIKKNTVQFASFNNSCVYDGEAHIPEFICDGSMTENQFKSYLIITKKTYEPELNSWGYWPVSEIRGAGEYKLQLHCDEPTVYGVDYAEFKVTEAPSTLNILNISELSQLNLGDELFIEWESDAPHDRLILAYGSDAPVDFSQVTTFENGIEVTKFRIIAVNEGEGILKLRATGSPNHTDALCEIPIKVTDNAGIEDVLADGVYVTLEPYIATVHGINEDTIIRLFDMSGKMLYFGNGPSVEVSHSGIYILVVNNKTYKIKL